MKAKLRDDRRVATRPNETWAVDFVHDQLATGRKIRVLTVVDTFSHYSPVLDPRFSYRGEDVVQTLERTCARVGYPSTIRVDQGSEFISRDMDLWAYAPRRHPGLLPAWHAHGQRLHRGLQRSLPGGVPERPLVPDACRRRRKVGGLAQILQRGSAAWGHRQQASDLADESRWPNQPATVTKAGRL